MSAAVWAALAATFSAISSLLIYRIQRDNLRESVRPELVLSGWSRSTVTQSGDLVSDRIIIGYISNVGRGVALDVEIYITDDTNPSIFVMGRIPIPLLAKDDQKSIGGYISIFWDNVPDSEEGEVKFLDLKVRIVCSDTRNWRYETQYHLTVPECSQYVIMPHTVAENVSQWRRVVTFRPEWQIKALGWLRPRMDRAKAWTAPRVKEGYQLVRDKTLALAKRNEKPF